MVTKDYKPTEDDKKFAKDLSDMLISESFKDRRSVKRHSDFDRTPREDIVIDTLYCKDCPIEGVTTCITLNSSLCTDAEQNTDERVEFISAAKSDFIDFGNLITGLSQLFAINGWGIKHGDVVENVLVDASWEMKHALIVKPFLWLDFKNVFWVNDTPLTLWQVVPINDSEAGVAKGERKFIDKLIESKIDLFDLNRESLK